ncbi:Thermophilic beta-amylase precursor [compost metagenome]
MARGDNEHYLSRTMLSFSGSNGKTIENEEMRQLLFQNTRRLNPVKFFMAFLLTVVMIFGSTQLAPVINASSNTKIVVMLNLEDVTDFTAFDKQMATLKSKGVYGVEVDMWWNHFEPAKGQYDWSYYKNLFTHIQKAGLKIAPIFSFHQCGGNVGDTCNYPIPNWVWDLGTPDEMQFKSESGYYDKEYIAPWFDNKAVALYDGAFQSFAANMTEFKSSFEKFHIGLGPAGELRYPSYNFADGWQYPDNGYFQAYSGAAVADFQNKMQVKYTTIDALNTAWGTNLGSFSEVQPPANGDLFYSSGDYEKTYGVDFLTWYQSTLENHFTSIIKKAHADLDTAFGVPLSAKVPGIHWQYSNTDAPHSAEHATGLYDYSKLLDLYKDNNVDLTFTMLEMTNAANGNGDAPNYSKPQDLIDKVSKLAVKKDIKLEGENALSVGNAEDYKTIYNVLQTYNYDIFTLLRLKDIVQANGQPTKLLDPFITTLTLGELPQQHVSINIYDPQKDPDAKVFIVGNSASIGSWTPANGVPMQYLGDGYWQLNMNLTATASYEFKAVRDATSDNPQWGADPNLTWTVPYIPGGTAVFKADLQRNGQDETHKHYISGDIVLNGSAQADTTVSLTDADGNVLTAAYGDEKQSDYGSYGLTANADDVSKAHYYFEVPRGTYTLKAVNGNHSAQMTVVANSQTLSEEKLIDQVPDLQLGDAFTVTRKSFSTTAGVSASVNVAPTPLGADISNKVVIFMLMDGNTPVGINAVGASGSGAQDVSTFFNVTGGNYKLKVFVVDNYNISNTNDIGNVLAEPLVLQK